MIARDNHTRELLNAAARERLTVDGALPSAGLVVGDREWAPGDRVIARRNDRHLDVDNGTLATIAGILPVGGGVTISTDAGQKRILDRTYVLNHLEHAYAITGHSSQGSTVDSAIVAGRPEEFSREWAYTALSRARGKTTIHLIADSGPADAERAGYAPTEPDREPADVLDALARAMRRTEAEELAVERIGDGVRPAKRDGGPPPSHTTTRSPGWASGESAPTRRPASTPQRRSVSR